jgi:hypothetical protein
MWDCGVSRGYLNWLGIAPCVCECVCVCERERVCVCVCVCVCVGIGNQQPVESGCSHSDRYEWSGGVRVRRRTKRSLRPPTRHTPPSTAIRDLMEEGATALYLGSTMVAKGGWLLEREEHCTLAAL